MRALLLFATLLAAPFAAADQSDRRLDALFERLQQTENRTYASRITARIWALWHEPGDRAVAEAMERAMVALKAGRHAQAERIYDRVVEHAPHYAEGWNKRATARYLQGRPAAAAADIRRALVLEPRHFGALAGLGLVYMEEGRHRAAIEAFERALAINPHLEGTRRNIAIARERLRAEQT